MDPDTKTRANEQRKPAALLVVDQLGASDYRRIVGDSNGVASLPLAYVPRTTPVGHATISCGQIPQAHGVHGRQWFEQSAGRLVPYDIDDLTDGRFDPTRRQELLDKSLVRRIRERYPEASIVVVAAKGFIPFLFGGEEADVIIYPPTTFPVPTGQDFRISILVRWQSAKGQTGVQQAAAALGGEWAKAARFMEQRSQVAISWSAHELELQWVLPTPPLSFASYWRQLVDRCGPDIDLFYGLAAQLVLSAMPSQQWQVLVQSWFSTDTRGHFWGTQSQAYADAVRRAMRYARGLADSGFIVAVTSDHGGTPMRAPLYFAPNATAAIDPAGARVPIPMADHVVLNGDHLVGYSDGFTGQPRAIYWDGATVRSVKGPCGLFRSRGPHWPNWYLLPREIERFGSSIHAGGDHGACVDANGEVSDVDGRVPWRVLGLGPWRPPNPPSGLEHVAQTFMSLR